MPHGTAEPDDELTQKIREAILAGAAEGAAEQARQIFAATAAGLDEVTAMLKKLAADPPPPVTVTASAGLASAGAAAGTVIVKSGGAAAVLSGEGTLGGTRVQAAASLSGEGTLEIGPADVAAAAAELRAVGQPDVKKLAGRRPDQWTKPELIVNSLFVVAVGYWMLTAAEQQYLANMAALVQAVAAVIVLLRHDADDS